MNTMGERSSSVGAPSVDPILQRQDEANMNKKVFFQRKRAGRKSAGQDRGRPVEDRVVRAKKRPAVGSRPGKREKKGKKEIGRFAQRELFGTAR